MAGWNDWVGKNVFIISKNTNHPFTGEVIEVDIESVPPLIWITIIDKYNKRVTFVHSEIEVIKEEDKKE